VGVIVVPDKPPEKKADASDEVDINLVPACHRSWLAPTKLQETVQGGPGGKMQRIAIPMNVGTMFPCFGAACTLWDAEHGMCLDRSTPFLLTGRKPVKPVLPKIEGPTK
jgi:hypothetical protein